MNRRMGKYCSSMLLARRQRNEPLPPAASALRAPPAAMAGALSCWPTALAAVAAIPGADGETRTPTAFATAPSRQRVYQFHHVGCSCPCHFGTSPDFGAPAGALVPPGAGAPAGCGTSE